MPGANQPRHQPREAVREVSQPRGKEIADPITQGLDKIMSRFDQLEMRMEASDRRVDNLEGIPLQEEYFSDEECESDEREYRAYREYDAPPRRQNPRQQLGFRGGRPVPPSRRDQSAARDYRRRDGGSPRDFRRRRTTNWDVPAARQHGGYNRRRPTAWDSPHHRERGFERHGGADRSGVTMRAPYFVGSDASNWISRVEYYFNHKLMPEEDRLHYAVMLFEPPAAEWIFNYQKNNPYVTWPEFLEDVRHRFDPQSFKNFTGPLAKLVQTGSVAEYHDTFEKYLNRVQGLSEESLIPIFIEGLKESLQEKVELRHPQSLAEAMALALKLGASQESRTQNAFQKRQWPARDSRLPTVPQPSGSSRPGAAPPQLRDGGSSKVVPIQVSLAEKSERSRKGLCWHCPEKYVPGHVCAVKLLCYVGEEDVDIQGRTPSASNLTTMLLRRTFLTCTP